jgi:isoleucyl-tRNA synthetase
VVEDLSNWYVRRVRKRLWREGADPDKDAAYATLHTALVTVARLAAPFTPFIAEFVHRALRGTSDPESVHLAGWPVVDFMDEALLSAMDSAREIVEAGRAIRARENLNVRTPVAGVHLVPTKDAQVPRADLEPLLALVAEELNAKAVHYTSDKAAFQRLVAAPEPARIGPRFKQHAREAGAAIQSLSSEAAARIEAGGTIHIMVAGEEHVIAREDVRITSEDAPGYAVTEAAGHLIAVETTLTPDLEAEGLARELTRRIQEMRKDADLHLEDRIAVRIGFHRDPGVPVAMHAELIARETRAEDLAFAGTFAVPLAEHDWDIDGRLVRIQITVLSARSREVPR